MTPRVGQPIWTSDLNVELGRAPNAPIWFNDSELVNLAGEVTPFAPQYMSRWWSAAKFSWTIGLDFARSNAGYASSAFTGGPYGSVTESSFGGVPMIALIGTLSNSGGVDFAQSPYALWLGSGTPPTPDKMIVSGNRGTATNVGPNIWQFLDMPLTNLNYLGAFTTYFKFST